MTADASLGSEHDLPATPHQRATRAYLTPWIIAGLFLMSALLCMTFAILNGEARLEFYAFAAVFLACSIVLGFIGWDLHHSINDADGPGPGNRRPRH